MSSNHFYCYCCLFPTASSYLCQLQLSPVERIKCETRLTPQTCSIDVFLNWAEFTLILQKSRQFTWVLKLHSKTYGANASDEENLELFNIYPFLSLWFVSILALKFGQYFKFKLELFIGCFVCCRIFR